MRAKLPTEGFGDPRLVGNALLPTDDAVRTLGHWRLAAVWAVVGISPGVYAFATGTLSFGVSLLSLGLGLWLVALLGLGLSRTAARFGIGMPVVCRAAWGPRGAILVSLARWSVGLVWSAAWAYEIGRWSSALLLVATDAQWLDWRLPGVHAVRGSAWLAASLCILGASLVARGSIRRMATIAAVGLGVAATSGLGLVVVAGIRSKGFGLGAHGTAGQSLATASAALASVLALSAPALLSSSDWARFAPRPGSEDPGAFRLSAFWLVPAGLVLAFVGGLLANASLVMRGRADGSSISDAAGFAGVVGAGGGVVLALAMWFAASPVVGFYSPALALASLRPARLSQSAAVVVTAVCAVAAVPALPYAVQLGFGLESCLALLGPVLGVVLVDELWRRRGRLLLEEAYVYSPEYGPTLGFALSGLFAVAVGWALNLSAHPTIVARLPQAVHGAAEQLGRLWAGGWGLALGALTAALLYALLRPVEARLCAIVRRVMARQREKRQAARAARSADRASMADGLTNPHFTYTKRPEPTDPHYDPSE